MKKEETKTSASTQLNQSDCSYSYNVYLKEVGPRNNWNK